MSHGYQNRRICAVQAFCAAKSWRRWDSLPPSILITLGLSRLRRVKQKTRRVARHKRFRCAKTLVHKQFICLCAVKCPTDTKKKSTALRCSSFWWSEATQIRTIALWGIFGGDFIESDVFCAVFVVECNQNFFIIEINSIHECIDKRFPVAFHVRVELAEPGQPEPNLIFA